MRKIILALAAVTLLSCNNTEVKNNTTGKTYTGIAGKAYEEKVVSRIKQLDEEILKLKSAVTGTEETVELTTRIKKLERRRLRAIILHGISVSCAEAKL